MCVIAQCELRKTALTRQLTQFEHDTLQFSAIVVSQIPEDRLAEIRREFAREFDGYSEIQQIINLMKRAIHRRPEQ
jgi:hypothetical protein